MVLNIVIILIILIIVDLAVIFYLKQLKEKKLQKERQTILDQSLKMDFSDEAKTLKRVAMKNPKGWILAVDDEPSILDSFRKILVLEGFAVDTVESGPEALRLIKEHDYDFVYSDLKMPEMSGLELTRAVKTERPDIDVVIITGFATVESAVDAMKFGAMDYVQKPFTEEELIDLTKKLFIRRQARQQKEKKST